METWAGIGIFILGAAWVVTSLMCIFGMTREWARATPSVFSYLARNFMPYTYLSVGMASVGTSPHIIFDEAGVVGEVGAVLVLLSAPIGLLSMIHWPLWLSPPWYRRWYQRGGRMGNKAPLWDPK